MIFSVHMPKCGGGSFMKLLKRHFKLRYAGDYDYPIQKTKLQRKQHIERAHRRIRFREKYFFKYQFKKCIHGHFLPYKYENFYNTNGNIFTTWLRDPIERMISHYNYWGKMYDKVFHPKPLHRKMVEEQWTLEEFIFSEELRNIYSQFLWKFPVERFDFIGIMEYFDQDAKYFSNHYLGLDEITIPKANVGPNTKERVCLEDELIDKIKVFHAKDYEIYNYALQVRQGRR